MVNTTRQLFAKLLKQERIRRNWTQEVLAEKVGVATVTVGKWERGETSPYPYHRKKLYELLEIPEQDEVPPDPVPSPARPPEKLSHNYRGIGDPNAFCQAKGYNRSMLSEDQFTKTDVIACISQSGNSTENFTEQQVCQWQYPQDGTNIIGRLADFFDPASLQCYAHVQLLGEITTHLPAYCQSIHDDGVVLIHETNQATAYDLKCQPHAGIPVGLSVTDACQWFYPQQDAFDRLDSFYSQNGWQCWAPK